MPNQETPGELIARARERIKEAKIPFVLDMGALSPEDMEAIRDAEPAKIVTLAWNPMDDLETSLAMLEEAVKHLSKARDMDALRDCDEEFDGEVSDFLAGKSKKTS